MSSSGSYLGSHHGSSKGHPLGSESSRSGSSRLAGTSQAGTSQASTITPSSHQQEMFKEMFKQGNPPSGPKTESLRSGHGASSSRSHCSPGEGSRSGSHSGTASSVSPGSSISQQSGSHRSASGSHVSGSHHSGSHRSASGSHVSGSHYSSGSHTPSGSVSLYPKTSSPLALEFPGFESASTHGGSVQSSRHRSVVPHKPKISSPLALFESGSALGKEHRDKEGHGSKRNIEREEVEVKVTHTIRYTKEKEKDHK